MSGQSPSLAGSVQDWRIIACKLVMNQTLGLAIINTIFLVCSTAFRLRSVEQVVGALRSRSVQVIKAAWTLWP